MRADTPHSFSGPAPGAENKINVVIGKSCFLMKSHANLCAEGGLCKSW